MNPNIISEEHRMFATITRKNSVSNPSVGPIIYHFKVGTIAANTSGRRKAKEEAYLGVVTDVLSGGAKLLKVGTIAASTSGRRKALGSTYSGSARCLGVGTDVPSNGANLLRVGAIAGSTSGATLLTFLGTPPTGLQAPATPRAALWHTPNYKIVSKLATNVLIHF